MFISNLDLSKRLNVCDYKVNVILNYLDLDLIVSALSVQSDQLIRDNCCGACHSQHLYEVLSSVKCIIESNFKDSKIYKK